MHLLNTTIIPSSPRAALAVTVPVSLDVARLLVSCSGVVSHIGHESTAALLSTLLGVEVPMDRTPWVPYDAPVALVIQVRGRPPEGRILTVEEITALGYDLRILIVAPTIGEIGELCRAMEGTADGLVHQMLGTFDEDKAMAQGTWAHDASNRRQTAAVRESGCGPEIGRAIRDVLGL